MSARRDYPTQELQDENDRLIRLYQKQDKLTVLEIVEKYGSEDFKNYLNRPKDNDDE